MPGGVPATFPETVQTDWLEWTTLSIPSGHLYTQCRQSIWLFKLHAVSHHERELRYSQISLNHCSFASSLGLSCSAFLSLCQSFSLYLSLSCVQLSQHRCVCLSVCMHAWAYVCVCVCVPVNCVYCVYCMCVHTCLFRSLLWNKLHSGWGAKWLISGTQIKIQLLQFEATQE